MSLHVVVDNESQENHWDGRGKKNCAQATASRLIVKGGHGKEP